MDQSQIRPLKTLNLKSRPLTNRALAWSCDGELAVATDEIIYIFLPEYPRAAKDGEPAAEQADVPQHQFSIALQAAGNFRPDAPVNIRLCSSTASASRPQKRRTGS
uniref:Transcription factor IIIC 90kDa subunit N-terminal domain-containing protein n=1 Tax=Bionectria ochroleuca TaxID=29856 RepID=A0A8H7TW19_BIOOC